MEQFGGKYRVIGGEQHVLEGDWKATFPVIIEFENVELARRWYDAPEYSELKAMRLAATKRKHSSDRRCCKRACLTKTARWCAANVANRTSKMLKAGRNKNFCRSVSDNFKLSGFRGDRSDPGYG